ncbi:hypothetical protein MKW92_034735 [Papaver armeniacum]|nr:hypothetical protein MKW92_034735 [Papaver armeniacum]
MSTPSRKRLMRNFKRLQHDLTKGISGAPQENNIMLWDVVIFCFEKITLTTSIGFICIPDDTPWDGGESFAKFHIKNMEY